MAEVVFFIAALGAIAGAAGTVAFRNPFFSVLSLVGHLLCLAALFLLLRAEFVAAAQVVVYAGAVMVLYVFVAAYVGDQEQPVRPAARPGAARPSVDLRRRAARRAVIAILGTGLSALDSEGHRRLRRLRLTRRRSASCSSPASCWPSRSRPSCCSSRPSAR